MSRRRRGTTLLRSRPPRHDVADRSRNPTRAEILASTGGRVQDLIAPGLAILFCGINPGLYSAAVGHHFARPGNRFWPVLHAAGLTPRRFFPWEEREILACGLGITNLVGRATAGADEISAGELEKGALSLIRKIERYEPRLVAVLGIDAYRRAFGRPYASLGPQQESIGASRLWVLPNPSGLNAHYQIDALARLYRGLGNTARGR